MTTIAHAPSFSAPSPSASNPSGARRRGAVFASALAAAAMTLSACGGGGGPGTPKWPHAERVSRAPLPDGVSWQGVWFISTPGSRGMIQLLGDGDRVSGCWLAEDKHAVAHFFGSAKDNVVELDWTESRVGFAGAPSHLTAYLVMTPDTEGKGKDKVAGEYGADVNNDGGSKWEGVRQIRKEPSLDACKLDSGDTVPSGDSPLD